VQIRIQREDGAEAAPGEPGELVARGENLMLGYWNDPEETAKVLGSDGLRTGDLAYRDAEGFLYIVGRKKEMIKCGAHRVSPLEVEETLMEHPSVIEAAVVGAPDPILGEAIRAFVVVAPNAESDLPRALQRHVAARLADYKVPGTIEIRAELPKSAAGKILKQALRAEPDPDRG
jgi:long-chain acyl-CoA synthetase